MPIPLLCFWHLLTVDCWGLCSRIHLLGQGHGTYKTCILSFKQHFGALGPQPVDCSLGPPASCVFESRVFFHWFLPKVEIQGEITLEDTGLKSPILGVVRVVKFFFPQGATFLFLEKITPWYQLLWEVWWWFKVSCIARNETRKDFARKVSDEEGNNAWKKE